MDGYTGYVHAQEEEMAQEENFEQKQHKGQEHKRRQLTPLTTRFVFTKKKKKRKEKKILS